MQNRAYADLYESFLKDYDQEAKRDVWTSQSNKFKDFWNNVVLSDARRDLNDQEIDEIVRILDRHGKGNRKDSEAIASVMIPQGAWRRMFNEMHINRPLAETITKIFIEEGIEKKAQQINKLYEINKGKKNSLTGQSGNAVNALLAAYDPFKNLSIVSLRDRSKIISFFGLSNISELEALTIGDRITKTNNIIMDGFVNQSMPGSARLISEFCYYEPVRSLWKSGDEGPISQKEDEQPKEFGPRIRDEDYLFYMESQLEDFIIENWDKTELGEKYELIEEDGELVSQQYGTKIGNIDILAKEKSSGKYVIIELKKNQTSDDTIGQLTRYMGWIEEHKSNGQPTKGIIITGMYDERLYYAAKKISDVQIYIYKVDFKLGRFEK